MLWIRPEVSIMDLNELPFDALRAMHTSLAVPSGPAAPREALRAADVGFHVETVRPGLDPGAPLPMDATPARLNERVIELRFG